MHALTRFLYPPPAKRTVGGIVGWWERRRLGYNLFVGAAGLVTLTYTSVVGWALGLGAVPWQPVVVFGVLANLCYFLGPTVEILAQKLFGDELLPVGPVLYRMGLTFSVGLALFPSLFLTIFLLVRLLTGF